jgi:hypothetical protein
VIVLLAARARRAVTDRIADKPAKEKGKGRLRFERFLDRFGVPGASLLGPLALPTQFTSTILVAAGVPARRVIFWQAIAIVLWTTIVTISFSLAIGLATGSLG